MSKERSERKTLSIRLGRGKKKNMEKGSAGKNELSEGMILKEEISPQNENRIYTLLLKGMIVYLIVAGAMGSYLSSLQTDYGIVVLHIALLLSSVFCSLLYYNRKWQDIGYLILLILMFLLGNGFRNYINSGFYAVANDLSEEVAGFFDSNAMRSYGEQVGNRHLAITISMCYIGCVCCILMNIVISRRMLYIVAILLSFGALMMPLYLNLEPAFPYVSMLFAGLTAAFIYKRAGHYQLSEDDASYCLASKKKQLEYHYSYRLIAGLIVGSFLGTFLISVLLNLIFPKNLYQEIRGENQIKQETQDTVENVSMLGLMGLFNFYPNTGGLTNGTLGGVSAVRLDYEADLVLQFAPYTEERLYFKTFTGNQYLPFTNRWERLRDQNGVLVEEEADQTTKKMKARYEAGKEHTAKGKIIIENVAAATGVYLPYYSLETDKIVFPQTKETYTFYPGLSEEPVHFGKKEVEQVRKDWLNVPQENMDAVVRIANEAGLSPENDIQENVATLAAYYQDNIPYTLRPGATPYREDFVNYFLTQNRKGYCAHFASAAVLIFRYLGIPARYVEGYAIDPEDISEEGTIQYEEKNEDYYEGYSRLNTTAVVSVNATDANAHAWVEVFDPEAGWQVVEVTPASDEDESDNGLWSRILNLLNGNGNTASQTEQAEDMRDNLNAMQEQVQETVRFIGAMLLIGVIAFILLWWGIKTGKSQYRYRRADRNDKLVMRFGSYVQRIARKEKELSRQMNYREQINWMVEHGYWQQENITAEQAISYMEQAGFSQNMLSEEEFTSVLACFTR